VTSLSPRGCRHIADGSDRLQAVITIEYVAARDRVLMDPAVRLYVTGRTYLVMDIGPAAPASPSERATQALSGAYVCP
jgi:hypothetical protein